MAQSAWVDAFVPFSSPIMSVQLLPLEILQLILVYLDRSDIYHCLFVCRTWYTVFCQFFYQRVDLFSHLNGQQLGRRQDFIDFFTTLKQSSSTKQPLGVYLEDVTIHDGILMHKQMTDLRRLCPNLTNVRFRWLTKQGVPDRKDGTRARYFWSPVPLLSRLDASKLTRLVLESFENGVSTTMKTMEQLKQTLALTPSLRDLSLYDVLDTLTPQDLKEIHQFCPQLNSLTIRGQTLSTAAIDGNIVNDSDDETLMINNDDWSPSLRYLALDFNCGMSRYAFWFDFIGAKYPELECLTLVSSAPCLVSRRPGFVERERAACQRFSRRCKRLTKIGLFDLPITPSTYADLLGPLTSLRHLAFSTLCVSAATSLRTICESVSKTVTHVDAFFHSGTSIAEQTYTSLGLLENLTSLEIRKNPTLMDDGFSLEELLSNLPRLQELKIIDLTLHFPHREDNSCISKSLHTLHLERVHLTETERLDKFISRCPNLCHLRLHNCKWLKFTNKLIYLCVPNHRFRSVDIKFPKYIGRVRTYVHFFQTEIDDDRNGQTRYFHAVDLPPMPEKRDLRRPKRPRLLEIDSKTWEARSISRHSVERTQKRRKLRQSQERATNYKAIVNNAGYRSEPCFTLKCASVEQLYLNETRILTSS